MSRGLLVKVRGRNIYMFMELYNLNLPLTLNPELLQVITIEELDLGCYIQAKLLHY